MAEYAVMPKADYQDACNAIREKSGSSDLIKSGEMGAAIREIQTGGDGEPGKPYIDTSKIAYFYYFFAKNPLLLDDMDKIDTSNGTDFSYMFHYRSNLQSVPQLNTSKGTNFSAMFGYCSNLQSVPQLDTSNGTNFSDMFYYCSNLQSVPQLNTSKGTSFGNMFYSCSKLETVSLTTAKGNLQTNTFQNCTALKSITIGEGWAVNIYLNYSNNLTVESLHGMIENLADMTGKTSPQFKIGTTNIAKIDEAHIAMLDAKNWSYS